MLTPNSTRPLVQCIPRFLFVLRPQLLYRLSSNSSCCSPDKYILSYETPRGARPSTAHCTKCKLPSHSRLACNECEFNICVNCVPTSRDLLTKHPHGKWTMRAPDDLGLGTYSLQCHSCRAGATLSYCGRCQNDTLSSVQANHEKSLLILAVHARHQKGRELLDVRDVYRGL